MQIGSPRNNDVFSNQIEKAYIQQYFEIKKHISLPVKLKIYFTMLQNYVVVEEKNKGNKSLQFQKQISQSFLNAFSKLSSSEKGLYLYGNIKFIRDELQKNQTSLKNTQKDQIRHIQTTCQMNFTIMKISYWSVVTIKIDKIKREMIINNKKKNIMIDLRLYLVRKSKKYKEAFVLESASQEIKSSSDAKKYTFSFENVLLANNIYEQVLKCILSFKNQSLLALMCKNEEEQLDNNFELKKNTSDKTLVFLNSKNVNEFLNYKDSILKKLLITKFDFQVIFSSGNENNSTTSSEAFDLKIERSLKIDKIFKMETTIKMPPKLLKEKFIKCYSKTNKYLLHSQILQDFSKRYKAVYEKYLINAKVQELISIKEENLSDQEEVLFVKGVQNIMMKSYLQYMYVKVRAFDKETTRLIVLISVNLSNSITFEVMKAYLLQLCQMLFREEKQKQFEQNNQKQMQSNQEEEFHTVCGGFQWENEEQVQFVQADEQYKENYHIQHEDQCKKIISDKYLSKRHQQNPLKGLQKQKKLMIQHYLFKEWVRRKNGGVICTNEAIIIQQKKIFKSLLTMMKNSLLSGGSILNISLPVNIFKKQSHLVSIGRDFCYAPLFFDRIGINVKPDPLERVKFATLLCISVGTLGISMDKPFNPILGETLQLWLGGCPMYLEQISHHPPIGSYYFVGRGYKIHGQIQPKISFGMNNVKGYSQRPHYLIFDDDTVIQMAYGKMIIKGMLFGERQFNFQEKIFAYDQKNHYFSQICYGPKKKGMLMKSSEPDDFCYGKIYKLRPQFLQKFKIQPCYPTKQYIISQLSQFEGVWNQVIKFDGVEYVNFKLDLPCQLQYEQYPLPSNSSYRTDLIKLMHSSIQQAQKQKERLEQLQRRDRRLRQNISGTLKL